MNGLRICAGLMLAVALAAGGARRAVAAALPRQIVTGAELEYSAGDYWNGADGATGFTSRNAVFGHAYNATWGSWAGFVYSRVADTNTAGQANEYAVWTPGTGAGAGGAYLVAYDDGAWGNSDEIALPAPSAVHRVWVNNTTYTALSMRNGDAFGKKFGGAGGDDPDWFLLTISGYDTNGTSLGSAEVYLADYRFADPAQDYIVGAWTPVDLSALGPAVKTLRFALSSSDTGAWGMNTPAYFALDDLEFTPQPTVPTASFDALPYPGGLDYWNGSDLSGGFTNNGVHFGNRFTDWGGGFSSWAGFAYSRVLDTNSAGFANGFAAWTPGTGLGGTGSYAVVFDDGSADGPDVVTLPAPADILGFYLNNTTYAALSMRDGDAFGKKFGGASGDDPDWFKLSVSGRDEVGNPLGSVDVFLADYRFADNSQDCILGEWTWVDLSGLGRGVKTIHFALSSSDNGAFGMNTPAYVALDGLQFLAEAGLQAAVFDALPLASGDFWNGSDGSGGFADNGAMFTNAFTDWGGGFSSWAGFAYSRVQDTNTAGFANEYAAWRPGSGLGGGGLYAIAFDDGAMACVSLPGESTIHGVHVNNTTYAARSMLQGDAFSKRFGGVSGQDPDWFRLTVTGRNAQGDRVGSVEVYLADYQFSDPTHDYLLSGWTWVDLTPLGPGVQSIQFSLSSSDQGAFGMNTPAYLALDHLLFVTTTSTTTTTTTSTTSSSSTSTTSTTSTSTSTTTAMPPVAALDVPPSLAPTRGGDADWFGQGAISHDGEDAMQSGPLGPNQDCWMQISVTGATSVGFWWRVSSATNDTLTFAIDDVPQFSESGESGWRWHGVELPAGGHLLTWRYATDEAGSAGANGAWVDGVAVGLFGAAVPLGGGWQWSSWFGYVHTSSAPWLYHLDHGWLYDFGGTPADVPFWEADMQAFWWTSSSLYPYLYRFDDNAWLWYLHGSHAPRYLFNLNQGLWESW